MSLVTDCPSCGVFFKVAPDQLLISEGWVRCGKCQTVFDAGLNLQPITGMPDSLSPAGLALPLADISSQEVRSEVILGQVKSLPLEAQRLVEPSEPVFDLAPDGTENVTPSAFQLNREAPASAQNTSLGWLGRAQRWVLYLLVPVLLIALLLQVVLFERNHIFSIEPRTKPWLLALCMPFNCRLEALKQIQSIVIDSSSISKISPDIYQLNFVLKNTAQTDLYLPSIELTLINALDQSLLRRVFRVDELTGQSGILRAASELPLLISFTLKTGELSESVAGYRLLIFYP